MEQAFDADRPRWRTDDVQHAPACRSASTPARPTDSPPAGPPCTRSARRWSRCSPTPAATPARTPAGPPPGCGRPRHLPTRAPCRRQRWTATRPRPGPAARGRAAALRPPRRRLVGRAAGLTFAAWIDGARPATAGPTTDDLDYHLSTLFPPVRPRGYLEVRYLDAQPGRRLGRPGRAAGRPAVVDRPRSTRSLEADRAGAAAGGSRPRRHGLDDPRVRSRGATVVDLGRAPAVADLDLAPATVPPSWTTLHRCVSHHEPEVLGMTIDTTRCPSGPPSSCAPTSPSELTRSRDRSAALTDAVDDDDLVRQHSPLMSPLVWDLAHIGNQEELWLVRDVGGREPVRHDIDDLYDAFKHPRADRPALPLLGPAEARALRRRRSADKVLDVLDTRPLDGRPAARATASCSAWSSSTSSSTTRRCSPPTSCAPGAAGARPRRRRRRPPRGAGAGRGARPRRPVHDGHLDRAVGAGQRAARAPRSTCAPFVIDTAPVTNGALPGVHRRRRLRRPALVDRGRLGAPSRSTGSPRRCSGSRDGGSWLRTPLRRAPSRCRRDEPVHARLLVRGRRLRPLGRASGCPPRPSGRRPPGTTRRPAGRAATRGATTTRRPSTPTSGQRHLRPAPVGALPGGRLAARACSS